MPFLMIFTDTSDFTHGSQLYFIHIIYFLNSHISLLYIQTVTSNSNLAAAVLLLGETDFWFNAGTAKTPLASTIVIDGSSWRARVRTSLTLLF